MRAFLCLTLLCLVAGCATTTGEPVYRLRPKENPETGQREKEYSGNVDLAVAFQNFDDPGKNPETIGFSVSARPTSWWIAPEVGFQFFDEGDDGNDLEAFRANAGARLSARFTEVPFELYLHGGVSYLDHDLTLVSPAVVDDDTDLGYYVGLGSYLFLGSTQTYALGVGYRLVDHDWEIEDWGEFFVTVG